MCGISVIAKTNGGVVDRADLARMCSAIRHRGPDEAGFAQVNGGAVGLAHVRLSIVDVESGQQPMFSDDGAIGLVFNGEIYDHDDLRRELAAKGHVFHTRSDTEVLLRLYEEHGLAALDRLNGEFAFVIWDGRLRRIVAARDYAGVKPLFYHRGRGEVIFCSEAKGILALPRVHRGIAKEYVTGPLLGAFRPDVSTFEGIACVKPGHYLVVDRDGVHEEKRYWRQEYRVDPTMSFDDAKAAVREHVARAVRRRLVADVPVHAYLSGGLDSTIVCARMAAEGHRFTAYSIAFGGTEYDESGGAARVAAHFGAPLERLDCPMNELAESLPRAVFHTETGIANPGSVAKMLLSRRVREGGNKVCLTGEGADELFAGYPYFKAEILWRMTLAGGEQAAEADRLAAKFRALEARSEGIHWNRSTRWRETPMIFGYPSFLQARMDEVGRMMRIMFDVDALGIGPNDTPAAQFLATYDVEWMRSLHPINATREMTFNQLYGYMLPNLADRVEMANSIECRTPFLDRDLLELAGAIPPEHLVDIGSLREKRVLYEAFKPDLPAFMHGEHKHPFMSPDWRTLARTPAGRALVEEHLSTRAIRDARVFNPRFVAVAKTLWRALPANVGVRKKLDSLLGLALCAQIIHDTLVRRPIPCDAAFPMVDRTPAPRDEALPRAS